MNEEEELLGELIPLAMFLAHDYERRYAQDYGEFETSALMGAWDAIKRYDPSYGASLYTYARYRIVGEIVDWQRKNQSQNLGGRDRAEMARCVDFNDLGYNQEDKSRTEASQIEFEFGRTAEHGYSIIEDRDLLAHLKVRMIAKEWDIMVRCVCNEEKMKDVGEDYGVSESRICQILPVALRHAREIIAMMDEPGEPYTGLDAEDILEARWLRALGRNSNVG